MCCYFIKLNVPWGSIWYRWAAYLLAILQSCFLDGLQSFQLLCSATIHIEPSNFSIQQSPILKIKNSHLTRTLICLVRGEKESLAPLGSSTLKVVWWKWDADGDDFAAYFPSVFDFIGLHFRSERRQILLCFWISCICRYLEHRGD